MDGDKREAKMLRELRVIDSKVIKNDETEISKEFIKAVKAKIDREQEVYWSGLDDAESSEWEELNKKWFKAE